jgi:hypothetical protein
MSKRNSFSVGLAGAIALAAVMISSPASAQMDNRGGRGPGMMYGQGFGPGMMGPGYGPGMMGCPMMGISTDGQASTFAEGRVAFLKAELGIINPSISSCTFLLTGRNASDSEGR